ncbi:hypothetical protein GCM10010106_23670 [Thermopolyspora flexuosa]|uniref:GDSL-like lipase/acylhydrolase family protein n=1 Tax=Thermopolyspora flexuosa TaxID=103836 RepID=A0A543IV79_9ACTN|nr:SGNH/GDSL hydrolase family protein [Thermopolyspora flexuosa]TQM74485.1 GDSL-like lipase/acylhydrolase family protein [Thermopolyspora flexuosa]GGM76416.1 hypothetical protein GCM10010106_23670 [Thermopolyspora flexuosa]
MCPDQGQRIGDREPSTGTPHGGGDREAPPRALRDGGDDRPPGARTEEAAQGPPEAPPDAAGRPGRGRWVRRLAAPVAAAAVGAALAVGGVPAGLYDPLACAVAEIACPPSQDNGEIPVLRPMSAAEVATAGAYVGLGDSYSSGEGAFGEQDEQAPVNPGATACRRSRESYVPQVGEAYRFPEGVEFWACGGATTRGVLRGQHGHTPQIERIGPATSLVTLTLGGNDAGFSPVLTECFTRVTWSDACVRQEPEVRRRIERLGHDLYEVIAEIRRRAPRARIIVVGYPRPFPKSPAEEVRGLGPLPAVSLTPDDQLWLNRMTKELDDQIARVANGIDRLIAAFRGQGSVEYLDAYDAFDGHEVGTAQPYLNGLVLELGVPPVNPHSFHPNRDGYRRLGELVKQRVAQGPDRPLYNYRVETR